ncbi:MAG: ABC transporter ATP-binding protein [Pollutimonas bauzanensis]
MTKALPCPKLEVRDLGKRYGDAIALEPSSLAINAGEFMTLLGPSGSGKTTLLQMISGLTEPTSGKVLIDGCDCTAIPVYRRDMGMVFQSYALFPHMSVEENIAFPLKMRGWSRGAIPAAVDRALDMVQMSHLKGRLPRELSGGQQQRIALARCFVYQPSVILMDEPLGALDKNLREHMQVEIMRLHRDLKATIVYVTHDQEEALAMSDRICLMSNARIEQVDTPNNIYLRPKSLFAARFIGESNILSGDVRSNGRGGFELDCGGFRVPIDGGYQAGSHIDLLIRPEHVRFTNGPG